MRNKIDTIPDLTELVVDPLIGEQITAAQGDTCLSEGSTVLLSEG